MGTKFNHVLGVLVFPRDDLAFFSVTDPLVLQNEGM